jgi:hypothetical protein
MPSVRLLGLVNPKQLVSDSTGASTTMSDPDDEPKDLPIVETLRKILDQQTLTLAQITTINGRLDSHD